MIIFFRHEGLHREGFREKRRDKREDRRLPKVQDQLAARASERISIRDQQISSDQKRRIKIIKYFN